MRHSTSIKIALQQTMITLVLGGNSLDTAARQPLRSIMYAQTPFTCAGIRIIPESITFTGDFIDACFHTTGPIHAPDAALFAEVVSRVSIK